MHTHIPRSNTSIELGRTHRRHHGTIVANEIARSQPHWRCVREVAGKRNTRGTSLCLLSRNGIVRTSRSARTPRSSTNTSRLTEILRRFPALPCYAPSSPPSFSFFTYLTLHSRDPYTPNKGGHTDVNIYIYIYELCITVTVFQALFNIDIGNAAARYEITLHVLLFLFVHLDTSNDHQTSDFFFFYRSQTHCRTTPIGTLDESSPTITVHPLLVESNEITVHARRSCD